MHIRRLTLHGVILCYLVVTAAAFIYTMTGWESPLHGPIVQFSYGMMAPYQYHEPYNQALRVEAEVHGRWQGIDHEKYWPFLRGERVVRGWLWSFEQQRGPEARQRAYSVLAERLRSLEGLHRTVPLRFTWETWPQSPQGFETLRQPSLIQSDVLYEDR